MDNVMHIKNVVLVGFAAVGGFLANALGGWDVTLRVLVGFIAADFVLGLAVAAVFKKSPKSKNGALESGACFKGLVRKGVILLFVWLGANLDELLGVTYVRTAICMFFIANEGLSILESTAIIGVPWPPFVKNMLEALRKQGDAPEEG